MTLTPQDQHAVVKRVEINLVLGFLEEIMYKHSREKHGQNLSSFLRKHWKRFQDDYYIIWNNDFDIDDVFRLNNLHTDINFTLESSEISILFLDVLVKLEDLKRSPDLFNNVKIGQCQLQLIIKHFVLPYMRVQSF